MQRLILFVAATFVSITILVPISAAQNLKFQAKGRIKLSDFRDRAKVTCPDPSIELDTSVMVTELKNSKIIGKVNSVTFYGKAAYPNFSMKRVNKSTVSKDIYSVTGTVSEKEVQVRFRQIKKIPKKGSCKYEWTGILVRYDE